jgi:SAM-dependent methyltransferase
MNTQNKWNNAAEAWTAFVRTGKDYYRDELNNPAMFSLLGDITGKVILDLACGEGYNTRIMVQKRATVTGIDFSETMIRLAREKEGKEPLGAVYAVGDTCYLPFFDCTFDVVTCFMALQDIKDYKNTVKEVKRVLRPGGRFVFVIPHPCFEKRILNNTVVGGWEYQGENALYYKVDYYFETHQYTITWDMARLTTHFETTAFHRTLTDYANALYAAGLFISRLKEPQPQKCTSLKETALRIPQSLLVEAVKEG